MKRVTSRRDDVRTLAFLRSGSICVKQFPPGETVELDDGVFAAILAYPGNASLFSGESADFIVQDAPAPETPEPARTRETFRKG